MRGYTKLTDLGNEDCIIMEPRGAYIQETGLPSNWTHVKIGMFYSIVYMSDDNTNRVDETVTENNVLDRYMFGLTNGTGSLGQVGNKFIGITSTSQIVTQANNDLLQTTEHAIAGTGSSITGAIALNTMFDQNSCFETNAFAAFFGLDLSIELGNGRILISPSCYQNITDVSLTNLRNYMVTRAFSSTAQIPGIWYGELTYFFARLPHLTNRLRIHAIEVMEIS